MARDLNRLRKVSLREPAPRLVAEASILLLLTALAHYAIADEALADPTRPPVALMQPTANVASVAEPTRLQSVILRNGHKPVAIIGGESVELGQHYNGARLVKVSESEVVLAGSSGSETLRLTPAVDKKPVQKSKPSAPSLVQSHALNAEANTQ